MSEEQLKAFMAAVASDAVLQEKLKSAADADAVAALANELGFVITADEYQQTQSEDLAEEELEELAGGLRRKMTYFLNEKTVCEA